MFATIGYEKSTQEDFISSLRKCGIEVLVDIRERAQSRRQGFSKTALATAVNEVGIEYVHVRALGDPKEGRDAAREGKIERFQEIFSCILEGESAQKALAEVEQLARSKRICLMCYEHDYRFCHRKMVSDQLENSLRCKAVHLGGSIDETQRCGQGRVLHTREGATA